MNIAELLLMLAERLWSVSLAESWRSGEAKTLERQFAAMAAEVAR